MPALSKPMRIAALFIGVCSILATFILVAIREPINSQTPGYFETFWALLRFFTIITNFIVSYVLIMAAIRGHWRSFSLLTGATVWIWLVGVIYHVALAAEHNPTGISAVTNHIHHTLVPFGTFLIWILARPRAYIKMSAPFVWLIFPLAYTAYMLFRGYLDGFYPYHFSDPTLVGWKGFFISQAVLTLVFLGLGFLFRWVSNLLMKNKPGYPESSNP